MKLLLLLLSLPAMAETVSLSIDDVARQVSEKNYSVYENALKVYQARTNIEKARAELLPKLNLWTIAGAVLDPLSLVDSIQDIAPFLVPANWFRLEESKLLYLADKEGYRALCANQIHAAKGLYMHLLFDERLLEHIRNSLEELRQIHLVVKTRELFVGAALGTARDIELKILGLEEDLRNVTALVIDEKHALTYSLGLATDIEVTLAQLDLPDFLSLPNLDFRTYEFRVLASSAERRQFDHFLSVLAQVKREIAYSFLGASNTSRGVENGIFDSLPVSTGLGFGQGPAMRIIEAQRRILLSQKRGVEETLRRQLRGLVSKFNLDREQYASFLRRVRLSKESKEQLMQRIQLGENISMPELAEVSRIQIQAETALYSLQYRLLLGLDRLDRLMFSGDYAKEPPLLELLAREDR